MEPGKMEAFAVIEAEEPDWGEAIQGEVCASWIKPFVDTYTATRVWLWYCLVHDCEDLSFEACGLENHGRVPIWLREEFEEFDLDEVLGIPRTGYIHRVDWALRHGIAPEQPFLLRIDQPRRVSVSWEYPSEYDIEWDWDLVQVCPWTPDMVMQNWGDVVSRLES